MGPKLLLQLQLIAPGHAKNLSTPGLIAFDHYAWSDDVRQVIYEGQIDQNQWNVYRQAVEGGTPVLMKTDARDAYPVLSPDGDTVARREGRGRISLYRGNESRPVAIGATSESEYPIRFVSDGKALMVAEYNGASWCRPSLTWQQGRTPRHRFKLYRPDTQSFCHETASARSTSSNVIHYGGGDVPTTVTSGWFSVGQMSVKLLRRLLPELILVKADQAQTLALHATLQLLASETAQPAPGSEVVVNRLADILFIQFCPCPHSIELRHLQKRMASLHLRSKNWNCAQSNARENRESVDRGNTGRASSYVSLSFCIEI